MTVHSVVLGLSAVAVLALHGEQGRAVSAGKDAGRAADMAAIEKARQEDIAATLSRDPVALTDLWTDDAIRSGLGQPADVGKQAIRASNEPQVGSRGFKVLSYFPKRKTSLFWTVAGQSSGLPSRLRRVAAWRGKADSWRGARGGKKLPDGSWKVFRWMGGTEPGATGKIGGL